MSDEYNDGFEAGYAYAKKEFEKEKERMIREVEGLMASEENGNIGCLDFEFQCKDEVIAIIKGEEKE